MKRKLLFFVVSSLLVIGFAFAASKRTGKGITDTSVVQDIALDKLEHRTNDEATFLPQGFLKSTLHSTGLQQEKRVYRLVPEGLLLQIIFARNF